MVQSISAANGDHQTSYYFLRQEGKVVGPFTQAIFVAATRCNFCRAKGWFWLATETESES